jgi:putative endonuclease
MKRPAIYILASAKNGTLYTGVTSDLPKRISEHKSKTVKGFTEKYDCALLVYYEQFEDMENAIAREKQIKSGSRKKKIMLIETTNPTWRDLFEEICG